MTVVGAIGTIAYLLTGTVLLSLLFALALGRASAWADHQLDELFAARPPVKDVVEDVGDEASALIFEWPIERRPPHDGGWAA